MLAILTALMVATLMAALDQSTVAAALPHIVSDLGGVASYSWMFTAYLLCQTVSVPIFGRLGDAYGRKRLLLVGITIFVCGSALSGAAGNMTELVLFRCVQGIGAGGVIPIALAVVADVIPPRDRGRYQALVSAGFAGAALIGPAVGGVIADNASWRWIFLINLPVGACALVLAHVTLPDVDVRRRPTIDYLGAALLTTATTTFLLALIFGGEHAQWISVRVLGAFAISVATMAGLVVATRRSPAPILPFNLVADPIVATAAAGVFVGGACMLGTVTFVPLFAQAALGWSASASGIILTPLALAATTATICAGQWVSRTGRYRHPALFGPIVLAFGMLLLSRMDVGTTRAEVARNVVLVGAGVGLMMQVFFVAAQNAVGARAIGTTTAFVHFARAIGTVVGVTLFGVVVNLGLTGHQRLSAPIDRGDKLARQHLASAIRPAFLVGAVMASVLWVVVVRGLEQRPLRTTVAGLPEPQSAPIAPAGTAPPIVSQTSD